MPEQDPIRFRLRIGIGETLVEAYLPMPDGSANPCAYWTAIGTVGIQDPDPSTPIVPCLLPCVAWHKADASLVEQANLWLTSLPDAYGREQRYGTTTLDGLWPALAC